MAVLRRLRVWALCGLAGCPSVSTLVCEEASQCDLMEGGVCLPDGACGYEDPDCESGIRRSPDASREPGVCEAASADASSTGEGGETGTQTTSPQSDCDGDPRVTSGHLSCSDNPGMLAWYRLDETDGVTLAESNSADPELAATVTATPQLGVSGVFGAAVRFDNADQITPDRVGLPDALIETLAPSGVPPREGTLELWAALDPQDIECSDDCARFVVHVSDADGDGFGDPGPDLQLFASHREPGDPYAWRGFIESVEGEPRCFVVGTLAVEFEVWTHLALVWDESSCRLFVNGTLDDESDLGTIAGPWERGRLGFPPGRPDRRFDGAVDEVMLFDHARSEAEIRGDCGRTPCVEG